MRHCSRLVRRCVIGRQRSITKANAEMYKRVYGSKEEGKERKKDSPGIARRSERAAKTFEAKGENEIQILDRLADFGQWVFYIQVFCSPLSLFQGRSVFFPPKSLGPSLAPILQCLQTSTSRHPRALLISFVRF